MKPGDFSIGSRGSRATARAMLKLRMRGVPTVQLLGRFQTRRDPAKTLRAHLYTKRANRASCLHGIFRERGRRKR